MSHDLRDMYYIRPDVVPLREPWLLCSTHFGLARWVTGALAPSFNCGLCRQRFYTIFQLANWTSVLAGAVYLR